MESVGSDGSSDLSLISGHSPNLRSPINPGGTPVLNPSRSVSALSPIQQSSGLTQLQHPPLNLTESMDMVNRILADSTLDRTERIDRLESLLTDMTEAFASSSTMREQSSKSNSKNNLCDASTQTVSTGDINITKVYSEPNQQRQSPMITSTINKNASNASTFS